MCNSHMHGGPCSPVNQLHLLVCIRQEAYSSKDGDRILLYLVGQADILLYQKVVGLARLVLCIVAAR